METKDTPTPPPHDATRWRPRVDAIVIIAAAALLLTLWGTHWKTGPSEPKRCQEACEQYMSGEPGAGWVAPHADGPGYNALLACMNAGMARGESVEGMTCWEPRLDACRVACVRALKASL